MLLSIEEVDGLDLDDLLARPNKKGQPGVRGPLVSAGRGLPLQSLANGDKLHIVATGDEHFVARKGPSDLLGYLVELGLSREIHLKQIHLIAASTGANADNSFGARLNQVMGAAGYVADEIKAPMGPVRWDEARKIWVFFGGEWQPSSIALNYYCGRGLSFKHQSG